MLVFFQDLRHRLVDWYLFVVIGVLGSVLLLQTIGIEQYLFYAFINISVVSLILFLLHVYARFKMKKPLLNHSLGLGDILLFYGMALCFPTLSFLVFFIFSIFFSLLISIYLKYKSPNDYKTVPLAGLMALFFGIVYFAHLTQIYPNIYLY
ncbi:MAG: hypothetical protein Q8J97_11510 [Flavobacteriaceae bacterium]|nr:hypothetical protein [Flavobacteriaceae bacterium]